MIRTRHDIQKVSILRMQPGTIVRLKSKSWYATRPMTDSEGRLSEPGNPPITKGMVNYLGREAIVRSVHHGMSSDYVHLDFFTDPIFPERPVYQFGMDCIESIVGFKEIE